VTGARRRNYGRNHGYVDDAGLKIPGVTGTLDDGVPKKALKAWAAGVTADYALDHWDELAAKPLSERYWALRGAYNQVRTQAMTRGSKLHIVIEALSKGETVSYDPVLQPRVLAGLDFLDDFDAQPLYLEEAVWSETHHYAGTFDWLGTLATGPDRAPEVWLLDWKPKVYPDHALQLAAYRWADWLLLNTGPVAMPEVAKTGVVMLTDTGYELRPMATGPEVLEVFNHAQHVAHFVQTGWELVGEAIEPPVWDDPDPKEEEPW
jgi:hypothetical protein